jgi:cysteine desulfurase
MSTPTKKIYLDNNATTSVDPRVAQAISEELAMPPSNPSSVHYFGQEAKKRLVHAREIIGHYLNVKPHEVIFTSGGTESMNLLISGIIGEKQDSHLITSDVEHACVDQLLRNHAKRGIPISFLSSGLWGAVHVDAIRSAIRPNTRAIILSAVNNETGVKHDLEAIGALALKHHVLLIVDGVALLGKETFVIPKGVSAMGFSSHKFHGPKGVGFAFIRSDLSFPPHLAGGNQEYGRRAGTENLPGIIGLSCAISLLNSELPAATEQMRRLRDHLEHKLCSQLDPVVINGQGPRIVNTSNLSFPGIQGEDLLMSLDLSGIAVSHGSACSSGSLEPSRVLTNMGVPIHIARSAIRFSLSRKTTEEEINQTIRSVVTLVRKLRYMSSQ